jgi:hypothetical protein
MLDPRCPIFFRTVVEAMSRLMEQYGMREVDRRAESTGCHLRVANETTGVEISYEPYEGGVFVRLSMLSDGKFPPYPIFINHETHLQTFDLQDIRSVRGLPRFNSRGDDAVVLAKAAVNALEECADRVLNGDFAEFEGAWTIVKGRIEEFKRS